MGEDYKTTSWRNAKGEITDENEYFRLERLNEREIIFNSLKNQFQICEQYVQENDKLKEENDKLKKRIEYLEESIEIEKRRQRRRGITLRCGKN